MTLYRKLIRPMHSYPGPDYSPRVTPIETGEKWYPEEEREQLANKYASYDEGPFSDLVFEAKYEPYAVEPIKPTINEYGEAFCICGENVGIIPRSKNLPKILSKYCSECGRRMKWYE